MPRCRAHGMWAYRSKVSSQVVNRFQLRDSKQSRKGFVSGWSHIARAPLLDLCPAVSAWFQTLAASAPELFSSSAVGITKWNPHGLFFLGDDHDPACVPQFHVTPSLGSQPRVSWLNSEKSQTALQVARRWISGLLLPLFSETVGSCGPKSHVNVRQNRYSSRITPKSDDSCWLIHGSEITGVIPLSDSRNKDKISDKN